MATVLVLHGRDDVRAAYEDAWPGAAVGVVHLEGSTPAYAALAEETPSILDLVDDVVGNWSHPLVVVAFSAGAWALRSYLEHEENRKAIDAAIFLDGTYGADNGACDLSPYAGVIEFGRDKILVMTSSTSNPEPFVCSKAIEKEADSDRVIVLHEASTHDYQLTDVGPEVVRGLAAGFKGLRRFKLIVGALAITLSGWLSWRYFRGA